MAKLKQGKKYRLKHTGSFAHAMGVKGRKRFSKRMNSADRVEAIFVGTIPAGIEGSLRNIFYNPDDDKRYYLSFCAVKVDYVVEEL